MNTSQEVALFHCIPIAMTIECIVFILVLQSNCITQYNVKSTMTIGSGTVDAIVKF